MPSVPPGWISDLARAVARHPVLDSLGRYEVQDATPTAHLRFGVERDSTC